MDELVKLAQKGDGDAFTRLMQLQMQNMYKTARAIVRNDEDAADAISDTILTCWEKMGQLRKPQIFKTWMTRILINKCNDILRRTRKDCMTEKGEEAAECLEQYENIEWLETLKCLDEAYRLVMVLYYVDGFNTTEISNILKIPPATERTRQARGREKIAEIYDRKPERSARG